MMSIRLRLTLLYSAILALTLIIFGAALYTIQAQTTLDALKSDLIRGSDRIAAAVLWSYQHPSQPQPQPPREPPPVPFETFSSDTAFQGLREREIVRVLDPHGDLVASPFGSIEEALPLSNTGLQALRSQSEVWEISSAANGRLLIYNRPIISDGKLVFIVQAARSLAERDQSLAALSTTLLIASLLTILIAFGIGWVLSGFTLRPIHRITQTAQEIGNESDFSRRVDYNGPNDEIGQLAKTFNSMLSRLQDAYQRVSQALSMQREFVADVSHELRTPLTTVRGNLALLRRDPPLAELEQADVLTDLVDESDRLIRLVNELLILARADAGRNLVQEPVRMSPLIEEACRQAQQLDEHREITATVQDVTVLGDRDAIKQVVMILLDNALKHTQGPITISAESAGDQVVISVQDTGPGIPSEMLQHVFDRFYRGEVEPAVPGFGLGLPIAKALVEGQGGTIAIESQPGSGCVVSVSLPQVSTS
jgi:two-component system, OmpR family, sensor kinase